MEPKNGEQLRTLFPHQQQALDRIRDASRVALFLQMRLGKTAVIIRWAKERVPNGRILILSPLTVIDPDWINELQLEGIRPSRIVNLTLMPTRVRREYAMGARGWFLLNPEGLRASPELIELPWDAVIVDESTTIRNPKAQITKLVTRGFQHVEYRAILSGDPAPEGPLDFFTQFEFLYGNFMGFSGSGAYWAFRHANFTQSFYEWIPKPGVRDAIKAWVHERAVYITRDQVGIGSRKLYQTRTVDMTSGQRRAYLHLFRKYEYDYIRTNFATVRDVWMARIAGGFSPDRDNPEVISLTKMSELRNLLTGELRSEQVVVWFRFNEELRYAVKFLRERKIKVIGIDGLTHKTSRSVYRKWFDQGKYRVLCMQVKLGRFGINLSSASTAIYYSNAYDQESRSQSEDRIIHPAKTEPRLIIDLVTRDTIDTEVVRLLKEKRRSAMAFARRLNAEVWSQYWRHSRAHQGPEDIEAKKEAARPTRPFRIFPADRVF